MSLTRILSFEYFFSEKKFKVKFYLFLAGITSLVITSCERPLDTEFTVPVVSTATVSEITQVGATSGGNVTDDGGTPITLRGICWSELDNPSTSDYTTSNGAGLGSFVSNLNNLTPNTKYYLRAYAVNKKGTGYGKVISFTTLEEEVQITAPTVVTANVTDITKTTATCGGEVKTDGGSTITARGVCWSKKLNPTLEGTDCKHTTDGTGKGSFVSHIAGLSSEKLYYVRAYAVNSKDTAYGEQKSFKTTGNLPGANFEASPRTVYIGQSVQFTDKSTNSPNKWKWSFGDGKSSSAKNPKHTYSTAGQYTVSLRVENAYGPDTETKNNYITVTEKPDLIVEQIAMTPSNPQVNQNITFKVIVKNTGKGKANSCLLRLKIGGETNGTQHNIPELSSNQTFTVSRSISLGVAQNYRTTAIVDVDNTVDESNENNNEKYIEFTVVPVEKPDLIVKSITMNPTSPLVDQDITFTVVVKNIGNGNSNSCKLAIKVGGETYGKYYVIPALATNQTFTVKRTEDLGVAQNYRTTAIVDIEKVVNESNEGNNEKYIQFTVIPKTYNNITRAHIVSTSLSSNNINGSNNWLNKIPKNTIVVYKTNVGRYGKFQVQSYGYDLIIRWVTYNANGSVYSSGSNLKIRGTWHAELDIGKESSSGADFWWRQVTSVERYLVPQNGALFAVFK